MSLDMPLIKSASREAVSDNIKTEKASGKPKRQAVAIALDVARRAKKAHGGGLRKPRLKHHIGLINSAVAGRTDKHDMNVPAGSYVVPADTLSGLGQGNTMAGADALSKLFKMGPYGSDKPAFADGGTVGGIPIVAAGGEFVIPPEKVNEIGNGDMDRGHAILDAMVKHVRSKTIKQLKGLPGPKRD